MSLLRERILNTATELFFSRGINSTGVDTIVAEAGTTKMTLYKYFHSKELLIIEVLKKSQQDLYAWLEIGLAKNNKPEDKLNHLLDLIDEWIKAPDFKGVTFIKASTEFPQENNAIHQLSSEQSKQFKLFITQVARDAGIKDAETLALQLALLIEGAMQAEHIQRGSGAITYAKIAAKILIDNAARK